MRQQGMTLIETLIVIALFGLLSMAGISFTSSWADSNRLLDGSNIMGQAFNRAKAAAIRNQFGVVNDEPAAALCLTNQTLSVQGPPSDSQPATCDPNNSQTLWSIGLSPRLQVAVGGATFSCTCLNNRGQVTNTCAGCSTNSTITLTSGNNDASIQLF